MHYLYQKSKATVQNAWSNARNSKITPLTAEGEQTTATTRRTKTKLRKATKAIITFIAAYFEDSNIHGLQYVVKRGLTTIEKCLWLMLLLISMYFCVEIGLQSVDRFYTKSTVFGLERDFHYWNTTMPSATICPLNRLDVMLFNEYCRRNKFTSLLLTEESIQDLFQHSQSRLMYSSISSKHDLYHYASMNTFVIKIGLCFCIEHKLSTKDQQVLYSFMEKLANSTYTNFRDIPSNTSIDLILDRLNIKPHTYMELIYNLTGDPSIIYPTDLKDLTYKIRGSSGDFIIETRQILTEYGLCYMTNTMLSEKYSSLYMIWNQLPVYELRHKTSALRIKQSSYFDSDVSYNFLGFNNSPLDGFLHSSYEVMKLDHNLGFSNESLQVDVDCIEIIAEEGFENGASVEQRKCRFQHESNLTHFPIYSRNLCHQECRLNLVYKICKCIPHFYPNRIKDPKTVCHYKTLRECVAQHEHFFIKLYKVDSGGNKEMVACYCAQNCQDSIVNRRSKFQLQKANVLVGGNSMLLAIVNFPTYRLKRQIIYSFTDLLVSIGGSAGLFLGFSVLCLVEIIYYFTLRLLVYLLKACTGKNIKQRRDFEEA